MFLDAIRIKTQQYLSVIRLTPFDTYTPAGRSKERLRRIALSTVYQLLSRVITGFTALISVPLTIHYLGTERYGLWMTISSVIALLRFADLGMGSGLLNAVAEANGHDDRQVAQQAVSSTFFFLSAIAVLVLIAFFALYPFIPWPRIFNVTSSLAMRESGPAMMVFVMCFALNLPLGVVQRVQMGYQEGFISSLWQCGGSVLGLYYCYWQFRLKLACPGWYSYSLVRLCWRRDELGMEFGKRRPWLMPAIHRFLWGVGKTILTNGLWFFVLSVLTMVGIACDNLIIAQALGAMLLPAMR